MRADAVWNRERLVDVAREAFARDGVDTSLEGIAREAGVGIGTLYRRFPKREDLIAAVLEQQYSRLADEVLEYSSQHSPMDALTLWLRQLFTYMSVYRGLAAPVKEAIMDRNTKLGQTCGRMMDAGESMVWLAKESGDLRSDVTFKAIAAMTSGIVWTVEQSAGKHPGDPVEAELLLDIMIGGLRRTPAGAPASTQTPTQTPAGTRTVRTRASAPR